MRYVAIDVGGTGSRWAIGHQARPTAAGFGPGIAVGASGIDAPALAGQVCAIVQKKHPGLRPEVIVIGMSGLLGLVDDPPEIHRALRRQWPQAVTLVTSDAVTALAGATGLSGGAVVAAGTGVIALGSDFGSIWRRVDGWGHLLGDEGGGAWIGLEGLRAALRSHDGRPGGSTALARQARSRFGVLAELPRRIYTRDDRAGVLASFAPDVVEASTQADETAQEILRRAGRLLGRTAIAAVSSDLPRQVSLVGGIAAASPLITDAFASELREHAITIAAARGTPLDGAITLALTEIEDSSRIHSHPPYLTKENP